MLLESFNATAHPVPEATLPQLFEAQVARTPEAVALVFGDQELSYGELNARANRLAHHLIGLGVGPEALVGVCLERSAEMVVAILAILKAGGAYVPLDPDYPGGAAGLHAGRRRPGPGAQHRGAAGRLPAAAPVLALDAAETRAASAGPGAQPGRPGAVCPRSFRQHPAYVIYTSGSTGTPKGVVVTHQNVVRLFGATRHWFAFGPEDVSTLFHSYAFDFSVWELWGALLHGGRLVVVPKMVSRSPGEFLALLVEQRVTVLNQTPSAFYQLMEADGQNAGLVLGSACVTSSSAARRWTFAAGGVVSPPRRGRARASEHVWDHRDHGACQLPGAGPELAGTAGGSLIGGNIPDLRVYVLDGGWSRCQWGWQASCTSRAPGWRGAT